MGEREINKERIREWVREREREREREKERKGSLLLIHIYVHCTYSLRRS